MWLFFTTIALLLFRLKRILIHTKAFLAAFFLSSVFFAMPAVAQNAAAQFEVNLKNAKTDSEKLSVVRKQSVYFQSRNPDSALFVLNKGLQYFENGNRIFGKAEILRWMADIYLSQGSLDKCKELDLKALAIFEQLGEKKELAFAYNVLGVIAGRKSNYDTATKYFIAALSIFEKLADTDGLVSTYIKLGTVNEFTNHIDASLAYNKKALSLLSGKNTSPNLIYLHNNIASNYCAKNEFDSALTYLNLTIAESEDPKYASIRVLAFTNIGLIRQAQGRIKEAIQYFNDAIDITIQLKLPEEHARLLNNMALIYEHEPRKALDMLLQAYSIAKSIGQKSLQIEILDGMVSIYKTMGDYKAALSFREEQKVLSDSIFSIEKEQAIANLEAKHEVENSNAQIKRLELTEQKQRIETNRIIVILIMLAAFLLVVAYFLWKTRVLNKEITASKQQLQRENMLKDKLFSIIGHDLLGPVSSIPVVMEMYRDETTTPEERHLLLSLLEKNAISTHETLQNLLDWGKSLIKGIVIQPAMLHVNTLIANDLKLVGIAATSKNIKLINDIASDTEVYCDPNHFKFIIRNLLSNAVKYTFEGGSVRLTASKPHGHKLVIFAVEDTGMGVPAAKLTTIFDSFGESTAGTENEKGNGIGLRLCKEFVVENGGTIWVESEQNKGATFYFSVRAEKG
jgi:signal transduction histidine kinase